MFDELIGRLKDAIDRVTNRIEPEESNVVIRDGVIVTEPPHDEEIDPNAESAAHEKARHIAQYHTYAQELCAKNKREGIWIELLLLGVQISSIKDGTLDGEKFFHRVKARQHVATIPDWCLEIMNQGVTKASALAHLLESREYELDDCIAFGDGMNDIEMLTEVGRGCMMGNADPRVKAALPHLQQIGLNRDESVATYLRALFNLV